MKKGTFMLGVVAGATAGAFLGVLFAPKKGANTRKDLIRKGEDLLDAFNEEMEEKYEDWKHLAFEKIREIKANGHSAKKEKVH